MPQGDAPVLSPFTIVIEQLTPHEATLAAELTRAFRKLETLAISHLLLGVIAFFVGGIVTMGVASSWYGDEASMLTDVGGLFIGGAAVVLAVVGTARLVYFRRQQRMIRAGLRELWASPYAPSLLAKLEALKSAREMVERYEDLTRGVFVELLPAAERVATR